MVVKTPHNRVLFVHSLTRLLLGGVFVVLMLMFAVLRTPVQQAQAATASTINFQARLMGSAGQLVADGNYHVEFKLFNASSSSGSSQGSCSGDANCLWTETRTTGNLVTVKNGYLTVNLGSVTGFPSTINWDQDLWLTMNIGGTAGSPTWDGEMTPRLKLTAVPYAFKAGQLAANSGSFTSTLKLATPTANDTFTIQPGAGGSYDVCTTFSVCTGYAASSGSGSYIQNQFASAQAANFFITNSGATTDVTAKIKQSASQSGDLFQLQDSSGNPIGGFNSTGQLFLGRPSNTVGTALFYGSGSANSIALQGPASPGSGLTLTLPNETGTLCSTGSICSGYSGALTFNNGITNTSGTVQLGGNLVQNTTIGAGNSFGVTLTSDLSGGARSTYPLTISQANNVTNDNSAGLLNLSNSDTGSTAALLNINQAATSGTGINIATNTNFGLSGSGVTTGSVVFANGLTSGNGLFVSSAGGAYAAVHLDLSNSAESAASALLVDGSASGGLVNYTGKLINIAPTRTNTNTVGTVTDSGNFLNLTRSNTQNGAGGTFAITGALANLQSNCTQTAGTCTDSANVLSLNQQYASASGAVLNISGNGTGALLNATDATTSVNVLTLADGGLLTIQPAASLTSGQTHVTQTLTNASSTGGTVQGYSQTITVNNTSSASTTNGVNIALTDSSTASLANTNTGINLAVTNNATSGNPASIDTGLKVTLSGSDTGSKRIGVDISTTTGFGLRAVNSGAGAFMTCANNSNGTGIAVCADSTSTSANAGVYSRSGGSGSLTAVSGNGAGVYGVNTATGTGTNAYIGLQGYASQSNSAAISSVGVLGTAANTTAGSGAVYGGYFTLDSTNKATAGAVLTAVGVQPASVAGNGANAVSTFAVSGGQGGNSSGTTGQTGGTGAGVSVTAGKGGNVAGASGIGGAAGTINITSGQGGDGAATNANGGLITIQGGAAGAGAGTAGSYGNIVMQGSGGNVGIGTSGTPSQLLSIGGTTGNLTIDTSGNFSTVAGGTIQGSSGLTLGMASSVDGKIVFNSSGGANTVTLQSPSTNPGSSYALKLPTTAPALSQCLANDGTTIGQLTFTTCAGASGDNVSVNGSAATDANFIDTTATGTVAGATWTLDTAPTPDTIALTISNASASVAGAVTTGTQTFGGNKTFNSTLTVQGANSLTLGSSSTNDGAIIFKNATNSNTVTLQSGTTSGSYSLTLPTATPTINQCLTSGSVTATQLTFGTCALSNLTSTFDTYGSNQAASATTALNYLLPTATTTFSIALAGTTEFRAPLAGSFRSCSIFDSAAVSGGSVSVHFRKNGADTSATNYCTLDTTNTRSNSQVVNSGIETFAAGDTIGVALVSSSLAPTTNEHWVTFTVEYNNSGSSAAAVTLQDAYNAGSPGDQAITLNSSQDSLKISNPASSGTASAYTLKVEELNTGTGQSALVVTHAGGAGTYALRVNDDGTDTDSTPFVIDDTGNVGIGTTTPTAVLHVVGSQPASVGTATGTTAASVLKVTGGTGGDTTIATTGTGGVGGPLTLQGGTGGQATAAATTSTGGTGGLLTFTGGVGGAASVAGTGANNGGAGGAFSWIAGVGGAATGVTSGNNTGGIGGAITLQSGTGGAANSGSGTLNTGGAGGALTLQSGTGGAGDLIGGNGGTLTVSGGSGGVGTTSGGNGGAVTLQGGAAAAMAGAAGGAINLLGRTGPGTGSGGNGGAVTITAGSAGGDNTVNRTGGAITITTGGSKGASSAGTLTLQGGSAGNNLTTGTASGGIGGGFTFNLGTGGTAPNADVASTGGAGGAFSINGGGGSVANVAGTGNNTGGAGGAFTWTAGTGGVANGATSGNNTGGGGGNITLQSGTGGAGNTGSGAVNTGGNGGTMTLQAGNGGAGDLIGGTGGALTLSGGAGGLGTTTGGTGGAVTLQGGQAAAMAGANGGAITLAGRAGSTTGSGGAGGTVSITGGAAGGDNTVSRAGGSITLTAGVSKGAATAGGGITLQAGTGGNNTATGTASGSTGGAYTFTLGTGGTAPNADVASTGGAAGTFTMTGGVGGAASVAGTGTNTGGAGSAYTWTAGTGGAANGVTSGTNTGGAGGAVTLQAGTGGAATLGSGTLQGGNGGALTISGGTAGTGTTGGTGGALTLQGGAATSVDGSSGGGVTISGRAGSGTSTGGAGGAVSITAGAAGGDNTVNRAGGSVTLTGGASKGSSQGGGITLQAGSAGSNLSTGTATGPTGGAYTFTLGTGGTAPNADVASTGGIGGTFTVTGAAGGVASVAGTGTNTGGTGSAFTWTAGAGGAASGVTSGTNTGGTGGGITIKAGTGGAASAGSGTLQGGNGGNLVLGAGIGGTGATTAGTGGDIVFQTSATTAALSDRVRITATGELVTVSARAAIVSGDVLGTIGFNSNDTNLTAPGIDVANIQAAATATHTGSVLDSALLFNTTSGTTIAERWRITATGVLQSSGAQTIQSSSGALTITSAAAATWSTSAGALTLQGNGGVVINTPNASGAVTNTVTIASGNVTSGVFASGAVSLKSGDSSSGTSGDVTIDAGNGSTDGNLNLGSGNASVVTIGNTTNTTVAVKTKNSSTTAFQIQNGSSNGLLTVDTTNNQTILGKAGASGIDGKLVFNNAAGSNTVTIQAPGSNPASSYALVLPTSAGASGECIKNSATPGVLTYGTCGGATDLQSAYTASTDPEITLGTASTAGVTIRDNATPISGNLFEIQNNARTATFLGVTSSAVTLQDSSGNPAFILDSSTSVLKVCENVAGACTNYASISYASGAAIFAASSGITQIGNGSGSGGDINLITSAAADKISATKTFTAAADYASTNNDFSVIRNITANSFNISGNLLRVEDQSNLTGGGTLSPNLLYINQSNTSATGNLILAQTGGGSNDKFKVDVAGTVTIAASQSYTGAGALTLQSAASSALTITGKAASTWSTTSGALTLTAAAASTWSTSAGALTLTSAAAATWSTTTGDLTLLAGGANKVVVKPGTDSTTAFQVQQAGGTSILDVDSTNHRIGINTTAPVEALHVAGNVLIGAQADATAHNFATGCSCLTNSAVGTFGSGAADTNRDAVTSSVVYKGKLFISTKETDLAGVYRYDGGTNPWTLVTNAVGKAVSGDTANIDSFVMTVFNGTLYIGSQGTASTGAIYSSTTADSGTDVFSSTLVNTARGNFGMSVTTVDGVSDMVVFMGNLYIGTQEPNLAEIGRYDGGTTFTQINTPDGEFISTDATDIDGVVFAVYGTKLFIGAATASTTARVSVYDGISTTLLPTQATLGTFDAVASNIDVTSMTVWNGELYVAVSKANSAAVYRWLLNPSIPPTATGYTTVTNYNIVSSAFGKLASGDTANIDSIILRNYNGRLYAGSANATDGTGALYEYNGTKGDWSLINTTRGDFNGNTTTDAVSMLQAFNGTLYVGTDNGTANQGAVYTWSRTSQNSYALKFDSGSTNYGTISFVGDEQSSDASGRYGSFVFSHALALTTGAFDYAEDYPTLDYSLEPGEPVSVDPTYPEHVKKAMPGEAILGVVSENPGMTLSSTAKPANGAKWIPIALNGRVPVKVTTNNGADPIKSGDMLTLSDTPGVLKKAGPHGQVVGTALEGYSTTATGKIMMFVNPHTYLSDEWLDELSMKTVNLDNPTFTGTLTADKIKANSIEGLEIYTDQLGSLQQQIAKTASSQNNAVDQNVAASAASGLSDMVIESAKVHLDLSVNGGLVVGGDASFHGNAFFYKLVTFVEKTIFRNDVSFQSHVGTSGEALDVQLETAAGITTAPEDKPDAVLAKATVDGNDISGQFTLNYGENSAAGSVLTLKFKKPYAKAPHVLLTAANDPAAHVQYYIQSTTDGFKLFILNAQPAGTAVQFNYWATESQVTATAQQ